VGGDAGAALLVGGVAVAEGGAGVEFLDSVDALAAGVGRSGEDGVEDLLAPGGQGLPEADEFWDVSVGGAPGEQGIPSFLDLGFGGRSGACLL
jgi:hypothetical protein